MITVVFPAPVGPTSAIVSPGVMLKSTFFRTSLSKGKDIISIETEKQQVESYLKIQQVRYSDILEYSIKIPAKLMNYDIPKLTLQPLVENAVRHGLSTRAEGGTVTISTKELENEFMITIEDNGIGFDQNIKEKETDDRQNVGIENVKQRLNDMCHGSLCIESKIGIGTKATILLPKEETKNENSSN